MKPRLHIRQALSDPHLLGRSLLIAAMGEKLTDDSTTPWQPEIAF